MYQEKLKAFKQARAEKHQTQADLKEAIQSLREADRAVPVAYESLTSAMADHEAGEATPDDVKIAQRSYQKAKEDVEAAEMRCDVLKKLLPKRDEQLKAARAELYEPARTHYSEKAAPAIDQIVEAFDTLESANAEINQLRKEMDAIGITQYGVLPQSFHGLDVRLGGASRPSGVYLKTVKSIQARNLQEA